MLILWILFGVVIGMILAYLWLGKQHRKAILDLEGSWYEKVRRAEDAAAKAMAEAEAIKAGDDPKMVSLRRVESPPGPPPAPMRPGPPMAAPGPTAARWRSSPRNRSTRTRIWTT